MAASTCSAAWTAGTFSTAVAAPTRLWRRRQRSVLRRQRRRPCLGEGRRRLRYGQNHRELYPRPPAPRSERLLPDDYQGTVSPSISPAMQFDNKTSGRRLRRLTSSMAGRRRRQDERVAGQSTPISSTIPATPCSKTATSTARHQSESEGFGHRADQREHFAVAALFRDRGSAGHRDGGRLPARQPGQQSHHVTASFRFGANIIDGSVSARTP